MFAGCQSDFSSSSHNRLGVKVAKVNQITSCVCISKSTRRKSHIHRHWQATMKP